MFSILLLNLKDTSDCFVVDFINKRSLDEIDYAKFSNYIKIFITFSIHQNFEHLDLHSSEPILTTDIC